MRQFLLVSMLLAGVGCQGLHGVHCRPDCVTTEPCPAPEKKVTAEKPKVTAPTVSDPAPRVAVAQEVMLVPTMVYRPFVAANPTMPVRMGANMTVAQPQEQPPVGNPRTEDTLKKAVETCEKLQDRITYLENCLKERSAPTVICPPTPPVCPTPLFRRPLFNRCEPLFNRCEPQCETMVPCEQPMGTHGMTMPSQSSMPTVTSQPSTPPVSVIPLQQMPRRAPTVNID